MLPGPPLSLTLSPGSNSDSSGLRQFGDKVKDRNRSRSRSKRSGSRSRLRIRIRGRSRSRCRQCMSTCWWLIALKSADRQTPKKTYRLTDRQTGIETYRQTDR